jgi:hypothetical protein
MCIAHRYISISMVLHRASQIRAKVMEMNSNHAEDEDDRGPVVSDNDLLFLPTLCLRMCVCYVVQNTSGTPPGRSVAVSITTGTDRVIDISVPLVIVTGS